MLLLIGAELPTTILEQPNPTPRRELPARERAGKSA